MQRRTAAGPALLVVLLLGVLATTAACGDAVGTVDSPVAAGGTQSSDGCPPPATDGENAAVDYVAFLHVDGAMYVMQSTADRTALDPSRVGEVVDVIRCTLSERHPELHRQLQDGDAAFLPTGSKVHAFTGGDRRLRLTAQDEDGTWRIYEADRTKTAQTGADLLDLGAGVRSIEVRDAETGETVLTSTADPATVTRITDDVLAAKVLRDPPEDSEDMRFVRFVLDDGTFLQRTWYPSDGVLAGALRAPASLDALQPH